MTIFPAGIIDNCIVFNAVNCGNAQDGLFDFPESRIRKYANHYAANMGIIDHYSSLPEYADLFNIT